MVPLGYRGKRAIGAGILIVFQRFINLLKRADRIRACPILPTRIADSREKKN
jgi:hypothetical protein